MKNIGALLSEYQVKIEDIIENFASHYKLEYKVASERNIETGKTYLDREFDGYKNMIARTGTDLIHKAEFTLQIEDIAAIQTQTADGVGALFAAIMNAS